LLRDRLTVDDPGRHQAREASGRCGDRRASSRSSTPSVTAQAPARIRYGTRSPAASASRGLPASPTAWPLAHARFTSANANPWAMPNDSAPSLSIAIAGVYRIPISGPDRTISAASTQAEDGHGSSSIASPPPVTPTTLGRSRPADRDPEHARDGD